MTQLAGKTDFDVAVIGGGLVGSALSLGLVRTGQRVVLLDEGDAAVRASRAIFALVWVQSKGLGLPEYAGWTIRSSNAWSALTRISGRPWKLLACHRRSRSPTRSRG